MKLNEKHPRLHFFINKTIHSDVRQSLTKKILSSIFAIVAALFIALIVACSVCKTWNNFGTIFKTIFVSGYHKAFINSLFSNMAIMIVAGLAFIFAYKAGLFNIGISGQMVMGGTMATLVCHKCHLGTGGNQIVILIISMLSAAAIAGIVGMLKAFLNVNEVVSSIMFNWIIYYMSILILANANLPIASSGLATDSPANNLLFRMGDNSYGPLLIITGILIVLVTVIINFTVFGKKLKVTGLSRTGALASGYNVKANMIMSMAISGAIAGVLGCMVYAGFNPQMPTTAAAKAIPQEGFNGISVGLIAMCNPIATVPVGLFFSMVQTSVSDLQTVGVDNHIAQVVFGIVVYGSAAIALFLNLKPYWLTLKIFRGKKYSKIKHEQNMANIALIELAGDYNAQLKKYYLYNKKQQHLKCALQLTVGQKIKCFFANIKYNFTKLSAKLAVQRNQKICFIDHNKYYREDMVHMVVKKHQLILDTDKNMIGGYWFKPNDEILNNKEFAIIIEQVTDTKPSVEFMKELVVYAKEIMAKPFDPTGLKKIPRLSWLHNQRTGLAYRYDIANQNVLDNATLLQVESVANSLGLPPIKSKSDYNIAYAAHIRAYHETANEITRFYTKAYAKYSPNKKIDKISIFNPIEVKYNTTWMEKSYIKHLKAEIRKVRDDIDKPMFLFDENVVAEYSAQKGAK